MDDTLLVQRFLGAGGRDRDAAFEDIFSIHHRRVSGICERICGNRALAEDAVQETFLEVFKALPAFRGESRLGTWIYRVAVRTALRSRARLPPVADAVVEARAPLTHPDAALAARAEARAVQAALASLPAEQSAVVALFADDGLSHGEIAAILGIPEGTVWSRLHKARKALAAAIA